MTLHTVGPADMAADERTIGKAYQTWLTLPLAAAPIVAANYADTKWVIAVTGSILVVLLHEAGGRLHDLCIRLRRTNILLKDATQGRNNTEW